MQTHKETLIAVSKGIWNRHAVVLVRDQLESRPDTDDRERRGSTGC